MIETKCTSERFLDDIKDHTIKVIKDDGLYRHLVFSKGGSFYYRYEIITFPNHLVISGDCGTYVFSRIEDMFDFFFMSKNDFMRNGEKLCINPGYWGEKLLSIGTNAGYKEFSFDTFKENIEDHIKNYWEFKDKDQEEEVRQEVNESLYWDENDVRCFDAASEFESSHGHEFMDFWEMDNKEYTFSYLWNLYAIVHGIKEYRELKSES